MNVYPSTLADLQKGLEGLLREPCGCFEQTSTSNYPNVLILDYLQGSRPGRSPRSTAQARELLDRGYGKLTSFECPNTARRAKEGYEWFGGTAPPHEALTAYGLLQFRDMAAATRRGSDDARADPQATCWPARRQGRLQAERRAPSTPSAGRRSTSPTPTSSGRSPRASKDDEPDQGTRSDALDAKAKDLEGPVLPGAGRQQPDQPRQEGRSRRTSSRSSARRRRRTATSTAPRRASPARAAATCRSRRPPWPCWPGSRPTSREDYHQSLNKAVKWIGQQRGGYGGFGSTQSTILALKALHRLTQGEQEAGRGRAR